MFHQSALPSAQIIVAGTWVPSPRLSWPEPVIDDHMDSADTPLFQLMFAQVIYYLTDREFSTWFPERSACCEGRHIPLFKYLYTSFEILEWLTTTLVESEITNMVTLARDNGLIVSVSCDFGRQVYMIGRAKLIKRNVISHSMRLHEIIIHRYSCHNARMEPPSNNDETNILTTLRRASLLLAVRVAFFAETTNTSERDVIETFFVENFHLNSPPTAAEPTGTVFPSNAWTTPNTSNTPDTPTTTGITTLTTHSPPAWAMMALKNKSKIFQLLRMCLRRVVMEIGREMLTLLFEA